MLLSLMAISAGWMIIEYFRYASSLKSFAPQLATVSQRLHLSTLMNVFVFCGLIHVGSILIWFVAWHYVIVAAYFWNAWTTHLLNKSFVIARVKFLAEADHSEKLSQIVTTLESVIDTESMEPKTLRQLADDLRKIVG